jgi:hypothetical protein
VILPDLRSSYIKCPLDEQSHTKTSQQNMKLRRRQHRSYQTEADCAYFLLMYFKEAGGTQQPSLSNARKHRADTSIALRLKNDTQTGIPPGIPGGARCVQRFDDSLNSAIHITYRNSLRSSSMREPRDPLLKVVIIFLDGYTSQIFKTTNFGL